MSMNRPGPARMTQELHDSDAAVSSNDRENRPMGSGSHGDILALHRKAGNWAVGDLFCSGSDNMAECNCQSIRIHNDFHADALTRAQGAAAYTQDRDIYISKMVDQSSALGRRIISHELAHVLQQERGRAGWPISSHAALEAEARSASGTGTRGQETGTAAAVPGSIQRITPQEAIPQLQEDVQIIKDELDSFVYTEDVEERVIGILRKWAAKGTMADAYLDWIFDGLQAQKTGIFTDTTYYDAMLDGFERVNEVRQLREFTLRYRGRESAAAREKREEEKAERAETDVASDLAGNWRLNVAEEYDLPPKPENIALAKLSILDMSKIPYERLLPFQRAALRIATEQGPEALLRKYHFVLESERIERRKEQFRAIARPLVEALLWVAAEQLAALAIEAVAARLFAVEAVPSAGLALGEGESALGGAEAGLERAPILREGYSYQIRSLDPISGEASAVGRDFSTGEIVDVRLNVHTGEGIAVRGNGEALPIRGGRVEVGGTRSAAGQAARAGAREGAASIEAPALGGEERNVFGPATTRQAALPSGATPESAQPTINPPASPSTPLKEPPPFARGGPLTPEERLRAERLLNRNLGQAQTGPAEVTRWPSKPGKDVSRVVKAGPEGKPSIVDFTGRGEKGELVTVRTVQGQGQGRVVEMKIENIRNWNRDVRDTELARAMKAADMGDWRRNLGHVQPSAAKGAEMPYNLEPQPKSWNQAVKGRINRRSAEIKLQQYLDQHPNEDLSLEISRRLDVRNRLLGEKFVLRDRNGHAVFEMEVTTGGKKK